MGLKVRNSSFLNQFQGLNYCSSLMMIEIIDLTHEQGLTLLPTNSSESDPVKVSDLPCSKNHEVYDRHRGRETRQAMHYNVTMRCIRATIVLLGKI
jgi:hypothetical protein